MTDTAVRTAESAGAQPGASARPGQRGRVPGRAGDPGGRRAAGRAGQVRLLRPGGAAQGRGAGRAGAARRPDRRLRAFLIDVATGESADVVVSLTAAGGGQQPRARPAHRRPAADHQPGLRRGRGGRPGRPGLAGGDGQARPDRRHQDPGLPADRRVVRRAPTRTGAGWCACWRSSRPTSTTTPGRTRWTASPPTST